MEKTKGYSKIAVAIESWDEDDRQDAIEFATHPTSGCTAVQLYLNQRGIKASTDSVSRWQRSLTAESERVARIRAVAENYKCLKPSESLGLLVGVLTDMLVTLQLQMETSSSISHRDIQSLTALAKEARSSAIALGTPQSTSSMKELELGFALNFSDKLESIFEGDEVLLDRVKIACKSILTEIEGQYQN